MKRFHLALGVSSIVVYRHDPLTLFLSNSHTALKHAVHEVSG